jgi:hypothetical protein
MREVTSKTSGGAVEREPSLGAALQQLGPIGAAFGRFLCWRADLVSFADWLSLRSVSPTAPPLSRSDVTGRLTATLGDVGRSLAAHLQPSPCWSTIWRCGYRTVHDDRLVVVQVARDPFPDSAFEACENRLRRLRLPALDSALAPEAWTQFCEWARLADDPARERECLEAYGQLVDDTAVRLPVPIPELSAGRVLCWPWIDGRSASSVVGSDGDGVVRISEGLLDALLVLSVVDGDLDLEAMAIDEHGRLVLRRATRLIPVPPGHAETALEYLSAVVAADDSLAARLLARLAGERCAGRGPAIADAHWRLTPQIRADLRLRRSAAAFEGLWRALSAMATGRPLFLDAMNRSLVALGTWDAETPVAGDGEADRLEEAHWAVLGRLLRARLDAARARGGMEWLAAAGLSLLEEVREIVGTASETRGRDVGQGGGRSEYGDGGATARPGVNVPRQAMVVVALTCVWLAVVRWGRAAEGAWPAVVAAVAAAGLFWVVSRMGDEA